MKFIVKRWSRILLKYPGTIVILCLCTSASFTAVSLLLYGFPDFSNPIKGFGTQNSEISNRALSFKLLKEELEKGNGRVYLSPLNETISRKVRNIALENGCSITQKDYASQARLVFKFDGFDAATFDRLCEIQKILEKKGLLSKKSQCRRSLKGHCCPPEHIGGILSHYAKRECSEMDNTTKEMLMTQLKACFEEKKKGFERTAAAHPKSDSSNICDHPEFKHILEHLLPMHFGKEKFSVMILPYFKNPDNHPFNTTVIAELMDEFRGELLGIDLAMKKQLFLTCLKSDVTYGFIASSLVAIILLASTRSLLFTVAVILTIAQSMCGAYFFYRVVLRIDFFPFINLLAAVMLLGIGADDAFILRQNWIRARAMPSETSMANLAEFALSKSFLTMAVTSATTVFALLANILSHITAIKCFGVFASLCLFFNFLLVLTWLPACILFQQKYSFTFDDPSHEKTQRIWFALKRYFKEMSRYKDHVLSVLVCAISTIITKLKYSIILLFLSLFCCAGFVTIFNPGIRLPYKDHFQYFRPSHLFERYDGIYKPLLPHGKTVFHPLILQIAFGFNPARPFYHLSPEGKSELPIWKREQFQFTNLEALKTLQRFCDRITKLPFISKLQGGAFSPSECFADKVLLYVKRECDHSLTDCCTSSSGTVHLGSVEECLRKMYVEYGSMLTQNRNLILPVGRALFVKDSSQDASLRYGIHLTGFLTNLTFTMDYTRMKNYYRLFDEATKEALANESALEGGMMLTDMFRYYDLQHSLLYDTLTSILVSLILAFFVLLVAVRDSIVSLLAIFSIFDIMLTTTSILVLSGWELNVVESTIALLTVGLSFDFVLHYAVAFARSKKKKRNEKALASIDEIIFPVTMSMLTTFVTGLAMISATTLSFFQIGVFMMLISAIGWLISTIFFTSLLAAFGPESKVCSKQKSTSLDMRRESRQLLGDQTSEKPLLDMSHSSPKMPLSSAHFPALLPDKRGKFAHYLNDERLFKKKILTPSHVGGGLRRASMPVAVAPQTARRFTLAEGGEGGTTDGVGFVSPQRILRREPLVNIKQPLNKSTGSVHSVNHHFAQNENE